MTLSDTIAEATEVAERLRKLLEEKKEEDAMNDIDDEEVDSPCVYCDGKDNDCADCDGCDFCWVKDGSGRFKDFDDDDNDNPYLDDEDDDDETTIVISEVVDMKHVVFGALATIGAVVIGKKLASLFSKD